MARTAHSAQRTIGPKPKPRPPAAANWDYHHSNTPRVCDDASIPVKVIVGEGPSAKVFFFHKGRLTEHSKFCEMALKFDWLEGQDYIIRLPEDDPEFVETFQWFTYTSDVNYDWGDAEREYDEEDGLLTDPQTDHLLALWALGDKLMSQTFKDAVLDAITEAFDYEESWTEDFHEKVSAVTTGPCGLRRLALEVAIAEYPRGALTKTREEDCWEGFFRDVAIRATSETAPRKEDGVCVSPECEFHDHGEEVCFKKMF